MKIIRALSLALAFVMPVAAIASPTVRQAVGACGCDCCDDCNGHCNHCPDCPCQ